MASPWFGECKNGFLNRIVYKAMDEHRPFSGLSQTLMDLWSLRRGHPYSFKYFLLHTFACVSPTLRLQVNNAIEQG